MFYFSDLSNEGTLSESGDGEYLFLQELNLTEELNKTTF